MPTLRLESAAPVGSVISPNHFGVNFIDPWEPHLTAAEYTLGLDDILDDLGAIPVRWPGGVDIENYAITLTGSQVNLVRRPGAPDVKPGEEVLDMTNLDDFFAALATEEGARAIIEIPTFWLVSPDSAGGDAGNKNAPQTRGEASAHAAKIEAFVKAVLVKAAQANVEVASFEIGNEYRGYFSDRGYAGVLNAILDDVANGIALSGVVQSPPPQIVVQIDDAGNNRTPDELAGRNATVLELLQSDARAHVDAVAVHFYYDEGEMPGENTGWQESYANIGAWIAQFAAMADAWSTPGRSVELLVTEWGVASALPADVVVTDQIEVLNFGMMALAPTLEIFSQMLQNGADGMAIWPTRAHATGLYNPGEAHRPLGALFNVMADSLVGTQAIEVNAGTQSDFDVHAFLGPGADGQTNATAFVSSLTDAGQTVTITLDDLHALPGGLVTVQVIELVEGSADGEFKRAGRTYTGFTAWSDPDALASVNPRSLAGVTNAEGALALVLDAYEVAVIRYEAFDRVVTVAGTSFNGTPADERVFGNDLANVVTLGSGRDSANGGLGADDITGGAGDDTLSGDAGNDTLYGGSDATYGGIQAVSGHDLLYGGDSLDRLIGFSGHDTLYGGASSDWLEGGDGNDSLFGDSSSDTLFGGIGDDVIDGGSSADTINGDDGDDSILGDSSADLISGGNDDDTIRGGTNNDTVYGGSHEDRIYGDSGDDSLLGDGSSDTIYGGDGNDVVDGGSSADKLYGGANNDTLIGGSNNDTLYGGGSNDTVMGGTGSDVFVFSTGIGTSIDRITDFNVVDDTIWLEDTVFAGLTLGALGGAAFAANTSGNATTSAHRLVYETDSGALWFDEDGTGATARVQFAWLDAGLALTSADFLVI